MAADRRRDDRGRRRVDSTLTDNPRMKRPTKTEFQKWLQETMPVWKWNWRHQLFLYEKLHLVTIGKINRLMIFMPPRHAKSETVTIRYLAWRIEREPKLNIILGSYNQKLANRFSRRIRRIVEERVALSKDRKAVDEWETIDGGGVRAVGVGAGITGFGGGLVVIDDPVKNRAEAESIVRRDNAWDWFNDDIYTRLEPKAAIILIQTRWHEDDLAGRLIKGMENGGEQWEIVSLPALAETAKIENGELRMENADSIVAEADNATLPLLNSQFSILNSQLTTDPLGRRPGEALWPERFDVEYLEGVRKQQGSYSFSALYQQRPVPLDGGLFKREWFKKIVNRAPKDLTWARGYDLAISTKTTADYTASFRVAFDDEGNLYIADGFRRRIEYPDQRRYVIERTRSEKNTSHGVEKALHGQALVQDLRNDVKTRGRPIEAIRVDADKFTRALTWSGLAEDGKVILVQGTWIDEFIEEVCGFPDGEHDDQVDAVSLAVRMLSRRKGRFHTFK